MIELSITDKSATGGACACGGMCGGHAAEQSHDASGCACGGHGACDHGAHDHGAIHSHGAHAHGEEPDEWSSEDRQQVQALIRDSAVGVDT